MKLDMTKNCDFAIIDVKTRKANAQIAAFRKAGKRIKFTLTGYLEPEDYSLWDGVSIEQSSAEITSFKIEDVKP